MAERPDSSGEADPKPDAAAPPGMPRWVKVTGIITLVVALVIVAVLLLTGGEHGPGLHAAESGSPVQPSLVEAPLESVQLQL